MFGRLCLLSFDSPINFLRSSKSNRFAIAATFGATASTCLTLFLLPNHFEFFSEDSSPWLKVIQKLATVLVYGIVFYPFFACLTTKYKLIGSLMGFVYAAIRFAFAIVFLFECGNYDDDFLLSLLPMLCCLLFILLRFAVLLGIQVQKQWFSDSSCGTWLQRATVSEPDADSLLNGSTEIERVSRLLNFDRNKAASDEKGLRKLLYYIYQPRPDFRFSTQFLATLIVAGITLFEIAVSLLVFSDHLKKSLCSRNDYQFCRSLNIFLGSLKAACVSSSLISAILLLHFMKCHRDHVFQLYRGERKLYQDVLVSPRALVGKSLRFSGYQISHSILGFLCLLVPIVVSAFIAGLVSAYSHDPLIQQMLKWLGEVALGFLPTVVLSLLLWLFQLFLAFFVFCDRDFPNITITVDNRCINAKNYNDDSKDNARILRCNWLNEKNNRAARAARILLRDFDVVRQIATWNFQI